MLVKQNLYVNPKFRQIEGKLEIKDGLLVANNLLGGVNDFVHEKYNLTVGKNYYVGFVGKVNGKLRLYKEKYLDITNKGDVHYIEHIYSENTKPIHMWGYDTDLFIEKFFITDEIPDLVIPNEKDIKADNQAVYPAGGYSKRCIHSNIKTSRNRPVKFGGGIC